MQTDKFTKLSELVGGEFTVERVDSYVWKKWDDVAKKMLTSDVYEEGFRKIYPVTTDKGKLDMGQGQIGSLLEPVFHAGKADIIGVTYAVKSNGKSGMDIRYYFNPQKQEKKPVVADDTSYSDQDIGW